ncbi:hypothetical protein BYT27DRAFT_7104357, partial [Phlegmacium glaucopus]
GVVYHSQDHFTSRFITETGSMELSTPGQRVEYEGNVNIPTCRSRVATCAILCNLLPSQSELGSALKKTACSNQLVHFRRSNKDTDPYIFVAEVSSLLIPIRSIHKRTTSYVR